MKTFTDNNKKKWSIELNLYMIQRVFDETQIDLLLPEVYLAQAAMHPLVFAQILPILLEDQLKEAGIETQAQVLQAFSGQVYFAAEEAFYKELMDFFRAAGRTGSYKRISTFLQEMREADQRGSGTNGTIVEETGNPTSTEI